jgi:Flp pilus assembly pilin Flp
MLAVLWRDEGGLTTVEYALLLVLVAIAAVTLWAALGSRVDGMVSPAESSVTGN